MFLPTYVTDRIVISPMPNALRFDRFINSFGNP
jgi:hypothetical protein